MGRDWDFCLRRLTFLRHGASEFLSTMDLTGGMSAGFVMGPGIGAGLGPVMSASKPMLDSFRDAALVIVAHGSTINEDSAAPAWEHAERIRRMGIFGEVTEAFWKQEPPISGLLRHVVASRIFVVPLFISEGWFTEQVIPHVLGLRHSTHGAFARVQVREGRTVHYAAPVGSHASMTGVLLARARDVVERHPFPRAPKPADTTLVIAGHGTTYARGSRESIERQVPLLKEAGGYADVFGVFLEEEPLVRESWERASTRNIVLVPYFISDGLHTREDIPLLLGEPESMVRGRLAAGQPTWRNPTERHGKRLWLAGAIGTEPLLSEVILERVREVAVLADQGRSNVSTGA